MRVLVNYQFRHDSWFTHCLAADARSPISEYVKVRELPTLLKLFKACGATPDCMEDVDRSIRAWNRGSAWIDVPADRQHLLGIVAR